MPSSATVINWAINNHRGFLEPYAMAREMQVWGMYDEIIDIADDSSNDWIEVENGDGTTDFVYNMEAIRRSRLRVNARLWILSKILTKTFGGSDSK